jgi:hypothetical protein
MLTRAADPVPVSRIILLLLVRVKTEFAEFVSTDPLSIPIVPPDQELETPPIVSVLPFSASELLPPLTLTPPFAKIDPPPAKVPAVHDKRPLSVSV